MACSPPDKEVLPIPRWQPLTKLICGSHARHGTLGASLGVLGATIDNALRRIAGERPFNTDAKRIAAAFYSRSVLEASLSSLIARTDPFRVLIVRSVQSQPGYKIEIKSKSAIEWLGDVLPKDRPPHDMWASTHPADKFDRSLLGGYQAEVFWEPAFQDVVDDPVVQAETGSDWLRELVGYTPRQFTTVNRAMAKDLFSSLSKGVHQEFLVGPNVMYDEATVTQLVADTIRLCTSLGLISHKLCPGIAAVSMKTALGWFRRTEEDQP